MALTIGSGLLLGVAALAARGGRPAYGLWPVLLLSAFAALSAISIVWSVQPDESWRDAGRLLAYAAVFAVAVAGARLAPARWPAILGGIVLSSVVDLLLRPRDQGLPEHFPSANDYARLYEPYGYWNALGLTAAMGAIGCMWLGGRRGGACPAQRPGLPGDGGAAADAAAGVLARRPGRPGPGAGALVRDRAAAPARRGRADRRRHMRRGDRRVGLQDAGTELGKSAHRRSDRRRAPARRAGDRDDRRADAGRCRDLLCDRPAGACAGAPAAGRHGPAGPAGDCDPAGRGRPRPQPPGLHGHDLPRSAHAHGHPREGAPTRRGA